MVGDEPAEVEAAAGCDTGTTVPQPADNPGLVADCETLLGLRAELAGTATLDWSAAVPMARWQA